MVAAKVVEFQTTCPQILDVEEEAGPNTFKVYCSLSLLLAGGVCSSPVNACVVHVRVPVACCVLWVPCALFVVPCSLFPVRCSLFVVPCSSFLVPSSSFLVVCSLFLVPCSSFLAPCSLFLIPHSVLLVPRALFLVAYFSFLVPFSAFIIPCSLSLVPPLLTCVGLGVGTWIQPAVALLAHFLFAGHAERTATLHEYGAVPRD